MQSFASLEQVMATVPGTLVMALRRVDTGRGREDLYRNQLPELLTELAARARVASITASSALEGVVVPDPDRASRIIEGKVRTLRTRSEQELAGYRGALDYLFTTDWRPLNVGLLLHLHRLLFEHTKARGGAFKDNDNLVVDRLPDGTTEIRFVPVSAARTEYSTVELVDRFDESIRADRFHPVLLIGLFVLDLLTIHPFADGNGRVVRAVTNALLSDAGYGVGRYVSLEQLIAEDAEGYYRTLLSSTHGWHEGEHDPWPWLTYFVGLLTRAYERFEQGAAADRSTGTKQERVRQYVLHHAPEFFKLAHVRTALPGVSDQTIRIALEELKSSGRIKPEGRGRGAQWHRLPEG